MIRCRIWTPLVACGALACTSENQGVPPRTDASDAIDASSGPDARTTRPADGAPPKALPEASTPRESGALRDAAPEARPPNDADATPEDAGTPVSRFCGDKIRDPVLEECDDGPGDDDDTCTPDCRTRGAYVTEPTASVDAGPLFTAQRSLGSGPHSIAASPRGGAIVYQESDPSAHVWLQAFDRVGHRLNDPIEVSAGRDPAGIANPVVAALPNGTYAVAWTDGADGSPDVMLRSVDPATRALGAPHAAHIDLGGPQQDPDILLEGDSVIVAWTDLFAIHARRFDARLEPVANEEPLPMTSGVQRSVVLAGGGGQWALAWRADEAALDVIHVVSGRDTWTLDATIPGPPGDRPAEAVLPDGRLLVVFAEGERFTDAGDSFAGLRAALLERGATTSVASSPITDRTGAPIRGRRPRIATVAGSLFLAWESEDALPREVLVATVQAGSDSAASVTVDPIGPLPIDPPPGGARNPAIAGMPSRSGPSLLGAWEIEKPINGRTLPDLGYVTRPVPFLELGDGG